MGQIIQMNGKARDLIHMRPVCPTCEGPTRLVGVEPHVVLDKRDVHTFHCVSCGTSHGGLMLAVALFRGPNPSRSL
jgi:hypothetical protein